MIESNDKNEKNIILIVDDIPENVQILGSILKNQGYSFAFAESGQETFEILKKIIPDLILLDIMLPDIDGFEICEAIKENEQTKDIPIIFLSAKTQMEDKVKAFSLGAVDYITKPYEALEVIARVQTHIRMKKYQDMIIRYNEQLMTLNQELEKEKKKLEIISVTDYLTGLYNRRYIFKRISEEIERFHRYGDVFSIIIFDLDHFKDINDHYGHIVGDEVLKKFADTIQAQLRITDMAGRYGGEEFILLLPKTELEQAYSLGLRISREIKKISWKYEGLLLTVSGGTAEINNSDNESSLLNRADENLYTAKNNGRDRIEK